MIAVGLPRRRVFGAIVWRDYLTKRSYRLAFALDVFNGVLTLAIYYFISHFFGPPNRAELNEAPSYFAFAAAGILLAGMITSASLDLVTRVREEELTGTLETLVGNPISAAELGLGFVGFPFSFAVIRAVVYFLVVFAFIGVGFLSVSWIGVIAILLSTAAVFAAIAIAAAAAVLVFKRVEVILGLLIGVAIIFSGSVFPISTLPGWLQPVASILPPHLAFDGARNALFRGGGWALDALKLLAVAAVGLPLAAALFGRALRTVQRSGSLGEY